MLLRVRMLYYLRQEVIGDQAEKVLAGAMARSVLFWGPPHPFLGFPCPALGPSWSHSPIVWFSAVPHIRFGTP